MVLGGFGGKTGRDDTWVQLWREACPGGEKSVWTVDLAYLLTKLGKDNDSDSVARPFRPTFFTTATEAKAEYAEYGFCESGRVGCFSRSVSSLRSLPS